MADSKKRGNPNLGKSKTKVDKTVQENNKSVVWQPDLNRSIKLKNISAGELVYISKRQMGYTIIWSKKGDINNIELGEFINLKNSDPRFVTEPWVRIVEDDEIEILKYANIYKYYENILEVNNVADIIKLDFEKFTRKFDKLPKGYKDTVVNQAAEMIKTGELDSIKVKKYIEDAMNVDLDNLSKLQSKDENKEED